MQGTSGKTCLPVEIADLNADERNNLFAVRTEDGNVFEIVCQQAAGKENKWTTEN